MGSTSTLERLTSLPVTAGGLVQRFDYTLGAAGHRLSATSLTGRRSGYSYDSVYKLTGEAVTGDPTPANNGTLGYSYDAVGNRLGMTSTLGVIAGRTYSYDLNDRLGGDSYDANGNTLVSGGVSYQWDFEDRMVGAGTVQFLYDGDGNRVGKVAGGVTTLYLVDELNPTGYAQVVDEVVGGAVARTYTLGLQRVSQTWVSPSLVSNYYVYDGHGSVRALTDGAGAVTDAYEYDAFGVLVASSGSTPNPYLYTGEWFEGGLGLYYLRARWYRPAVGRFVSADKWEGIPTRSLSHNRFGYCEANPVRYSDPSGFGIIETAKLYAAIGILTVYQNLPRLANIGTAVVNCAEAAAVVLNVFLAFLEAGVYLSGFNVAFGVVDTIHPENGTLMESKRYVAIYGLGTHFNTRTAKALEEARQWGEVLASDALHSEEQIFAKADQPNSYLATIASKALPCDGTKRTCIGGITQRGLQRVPMNWTRWKLPTCFAR